GKIASPQEVTLRRRDGSQASIESVGIGVPFEGEPSIVVVVRDVAERVRAAWEQRLLAEVGVALASTLDYEGTLATVASIVVSEFADWCVVEVMAADNGLQRI